jgi:hypothetical protein
MSSAYPKPQMPLQHGIALGGPVSQREMVRAVVEDGWTHVGILDRALARQLRRAIDEVAARRPAALRREPLHQLSGLAQHPDLSRIVDWPPLLGLVVELLSPNVYVNHSHLDVHPPHEPTGARRWHRDNGLMGRDMRLRWREQPRVTVKVAVYLSHVESPDDGALEVVPGSHLDTEARYPHEEQPAGVPVLGPAGTVVAFDARLWHRRRDNLGARTRRAMFLAYSYRWLTSRDLPLECVPGWAVLPGVRRQLLGDQAVDPFYWASGALPLDQSGAGAAAATADLSSAYPEPHTG